MNYCMKCRTGKERQFAKHCFKCGEKLVDMPADTCVCGYKPNSHNAFCIQCGKELKIKQFESVAKNN